MGRNLRYWSLRPDFYRNSPTDPFLWPVAYGLALSQMFELRLLAEPWGVVGKLFGTVSWPPSSDVHHPLPSSVTNTETPSRWSAGLKKKKNPVTKGHACT